LSEESWFTDSEASLASNETYITTPRYSGIFEELSSFLPEVEGAEVLLEAEAPLLSIPVVGEFVLGASLLGLAGYGLYEWLAPKANKTLPALGPGVVKPPPIMEGGSQGTKPTPAKKGAVLVPPVSGVEWVDPVQPAPLIPPHRRRSVRRMRG
jgi:hypothetical protein